jgi:hypothetical protein
MRNEVTPGKLSGWRPNVTVKPLSSHRRKRTGARMVSEAKALGNARDMQTETR